MTLILDISEQSSQNKTVDSALVIHTFLPNFLLLHRYTSRTTAVLLTLSHTTAHPANYPELLLTPNLQCTLYKNVFQEYTTRNTPIWIYVLMNIYSTALNNTEQPLKWIISALRASKYSRKCRRNTAVGFPSLGCKTGLLLFNLFVWESDWFEAHRQPFALLLYFCVYAETHTRCSATVLLNYIANVVWMGNTQHYLMNNLRKHFPMLAIVGSSSV